MLDRFPAERAYFEQQAIARAANDEHALGRDFHLLPRILGQFAFFHGVPGDRPRGLRFRATRLREILDTPENALQNNAFRALRDPNSKFRQHLISRDDTMAG